MLTLRTDSELIHEMQALADLLPSLKPREGMTGENWLGAVAQLEVLRHRMSEAQFEGRAWEDEPEKGSVKSRAQEAFDWMHGKTEQAPSVDWKTLL